MLITDKNALKQFSAAHRIWQGIPGIARTRRGRAFISFYSGNVKETYGNYAAVILTARITEQDILNGKPVSEGSFLKNVVCKPGTLAPENPDPYPETATS